MAFTFETSGNNTFLVYEMEQGDTLDTMTLGMLANNRIPGMIPVICTQMNRDCFLKYNVTARVTLRQFFFGAVNRRRLLGVFTGVTAALAAAEEYMIDSRSLLLDMDHIYADVRSCAAEVICLPLARDTDPADIVMFFKNIMFSTQFDQTENCDYVARIINYLNGSPVFAVEDFQKLLEELQSETPSASPAFGGGQAAGNLGYGNGQAAGNLGYGGGQAAGSLGYGGGQAAGNLGYGGGQTAAAATSRPGSQIEPVKRPLTSESPASLVPAASSPVSAAAQSGPVREAAAPGADFAARQQKATDLSPSSPAPDKQISMLYLLQHYNKENAAAYKAQKEARKKGGKGKASDTGFAVPGQNPDISPAAPQPWQSSAQSQPFAQPSAQSQQPSAQPQRQSAQLQRQSARSQQQSAQLPQQSARSQRSSAQPQRSSAQPQQPSAQSQQPSAQPWQSLSQQPAQQSQVQAMPSVASAPTFPQGDNFGDTVVMGVDGQAEDTVVMGESGAACVIRPYLLRSSNNERIYIDKPVFRIGKERSYVDYCISGNATVSRSHADIIDRNGQFFIVDNNSTNHTFVDGQMIPSNTETALSHGTKIRLSNEEFEFLTF